MPGDDVTTTILREIRDELRSTKTELKAELHELGVGLGEVKAELQTTNARLAVVEHTVADAATQIVFVARYVKNNHEAAIEDLRTRVTRLEAKSDG
jgi:prefoldin subunit 5